MITRLQPYTPYEFIVVPFRRGLSGEPSALFEAWTLEARPSQAPSDLNWYQVNSSSIDVTWRPILKSQFRGRPLGYQVSLKKLQIIHVGSIELNLIVALKLLQIV